MNGDDQQDIEVWEENWQSVVVFLSVSTQWLLSPNGRACGINYVALESAMNMAGIKNKKRPSLFNDIRIMESTALEIFLEQK